MMPDPSSGIHRFAAALLRLTRCDPFEREFQQDVGEIEVKLPLQTLSFRLADCFWDLDGRLPGVVPRRFTKNPAIVLQTVSGLSRFDAYACVDGKDRELWVAFLTFAAKQGTTIVFGVPRDAV